MHEIAFIGTGIMGAAMAGHLMDAGYSLRVFNRSKKRRNAHRPRRAVAGNPRGLRARRGSMHYHHRHPAGC